MVYCSRCGAQNMDDSLYCSNCGIARGQAAPDRPVQGERVNAMPYVPYPAYVTPPYVPPQPLVVPQKSSKYAMLLVIVPIVLAVAVLLVGVVVMSAFGSPLGFLVGAIAWVVLFVALMVWVNDKDYV